MLEVWIHANAQIHRLGRDINPKNKLAFIFAAFAALIALFGMAPIQAATLTSIAVAPSNPMLTIGQTKTLTATGTFSDGGTQPLVSIKAIAAGDYHTCAVLSTGAVRCWGSNRSGELGNGTTTPSSPYGITTPVTVSGIDGSATKAIAIAAGDYHTCAVLSTGAVQCWGHNDYGQLGNDTTATSTAPVTVSGIDGSAAKATAIAAGSLHTCAVLNTGAVQCWGDNRYGEIGNGTTTQSTTQSTTPVTVSGIDGSTAQATAIAAGDQYTCAVLDTGAVQCWGYNDYGQLGNGTTSNSDSPTPVTVGGIDGSAAKATAIAAGSIHTCTLLSTGAVQCWGYNYDGELGNGKLGYFSSPVSVAGLPIVVWNSSDTSVATVDANGLATASGDGTATITATSGSTIGSTLLTVSKATATANGSGGGGGGALGPWGLLLLGALGLVHRRLGGPRTERQSERYCDAQRLRPPRI